MTPEEPTEQLLRAAKNNDISKRNSSCSHRLLVFQAASCVVGRFCLGPCAKERCGQRKYGFNADMALRFGGCDAAHEDF
jgi:hypothetical protein